MSHLLRRKKHPGLEQISRRVDGMLERAAQTELDAHLRVCSGCRRIYETLRRVKMVLAGLPGVEEPMAAPKALPIFVPIEPNRWSGWRAPAAAALIAAGVVFLLMNPTAGSIRILSKSGTMTASARWNQGTLPLDTTVRTLDQEYVDLEIPGQLYVRLKPGSTLTWEEAPRPRLSQKAHIIVHLLRGEMLARTNDDFWGSKLEIKTPTSTAHVKGTAFSVMVDPAAEATTLKVLAGSVFFSPHTEGVGVEVRSGQISRQPADRLPQEPVPMTIEERIALLETFKIGQQAPAALVAGEGPERVEELFGELLLYIDDRRPSKVYRRLARIAEQLNAATLDGELHKGSRLLGQMERLVKTLETPDALVPLHLYIGSYAVRLGQPQRGLGHFRWVADTWPGHRLAPLSLAALARVFHSEGKNISRARELYEEILRRYPQSPEADIARGYLLYPH